MAASVSTVTNLVCGNCDITKIKVEAKAEAEAKAEVKAKAKAEDEAEVQYSIIAFITPSL